MGIGRSLATLALAVLIVSVGGNVALASTVDSADLARPTATPSQQPGSSTSDSNPPVNPSPTPILTGRYTIKPWSGSLDLPNPNGSPTPWKWPIAGGYIENGNGVIDVWSPLGGTLPIPIWQVGVTPETLWGLSLYHDQSISLNSPESNGKYSGQIYASVLGPYSSLFGYIPLELTDVTVVPPS